MTSIIGRCAASRRDRSAASHLRCVRGVFRGRRAATIASLRAVFSLTNIAAPHPTISAVGGTQQSALVNAAFGTPLQVLFQDINGNPQSGATITFSPPTMGASATLSGTTAVTDSKGLASITATANAVPGPYEITASAQGETTAFAMRVHL